MEDEQLINIRYQRHRWTIVKLIASKLNFYDENGEIHPCTGSDIVRELLDDWLGEHSLEWYPKLLKDFQKQGIENKTTRYLAQSIKDYAESAKINKDEQDLEKLKHSMLNAGFTETEVNKFIEGEK